jgi:hypothetical protein
MKKFSPHLEILPPAQRRLWDELVQVPAEFTLYGGTAIALHLGHRQSVHFDFFGSRAFDPATLHAALPFLRDAQTEHRERDTLTVILDRGDKVDLDTLITQGGITLPMALAAAQTLYGAPFNPQITLKSLSYFDDGDLRSLPAELTERLVVAARNVDLDRLPVFNPYTPVTSPQARS